MEIYQRPGMHLDADRVQARLKNLPTPDTPPPG